MTTKQQLISTIAIGAAFMAASTAMPDTAHAWWWDTGHTRAALRRSIRAPSAAPSHSPWAAWAVLSDKLRRR